MSFNEYIELLYKNPSEVIPIARRDPQILTLRGLHGETLLHYCAVEDWLEAVRILLRLGGDPNCKNRLDTTPLIDASTLGGCEMVELLLQNGADPNMLTKDHSTALHYAADHQQRMVFESLVKHGGNPDIKNRFGETPATLLAQG